MRAVDGVELTDGPDHGIGIVDDEAGLAVVDQLGDAGAAHADDRRARRERLDHDEPERLVPRDREEERRRLGEKARFRGFVDLADEADALTIDVWLDLRLEPRPIALVDLAREEQASPGRRATSTATSAPLDGEKRPRKASGASDPEGVVRAT